MAPFDIMIEINMTSISFYDDHISEIVIYDTCVTARDVSNLFKALRTWLERFQKSTVYMLSTPEECFSIFITALGSGEIIEGLYFDKTSSYAVDPDTQPRQRIYGDTTRSVIIKSVADQATYDRLEFVSTVLQFDADDWFASATEDGSLPSLPDPDFRQICYYDQILIDDAPLKAAGDKTKSFLETPELLLTTPLLELYDAVPNFTYHLINRFVTQNILRCSLESNWQQIFPATTTLLDTLIDVETTYFDRTTLAMLSLEQLPTVVLTSFANDGVLCFELYSLVLA